MQKLKLTARFGRPTPQETRQYTTPTRRCTTETKLQKIYKNFKLSWGIKFFRSHNNFNIMKMKHCERSILWIWEIIVDFLVEYIEDDI